MALLNEHFLKLKGSYLFSDIAKKVKAYQVTHPGEQIIRLGIGDVTRPLPQASIEAMHRAVDEMASSATFHGYGPEQGYDFLIETIIKHDFARAASSSAHPKYSSATGRRATRAISANSCVGITVWASPIRSILPISTAT